MKLQSESEEESDDEDLLDKDIKESAALLKRRPQHRASSSIDV